MARLYKRRGITRQAIRRNQPWLPTAVANNRTGQLSVTLDALTVSSAGVLAITGSSSVTLDDLTLSSAGVLPIQGQLGVTLDDLTLVAEGTGANDRTGSLAVTLDPLTVSSAGTLAITGSVSVTLDNVTLSASGQGPSTEDTIDGAASYTISAAYGSVMLYHRGDRRFFTI